MIDEVDPARAEARLRELILYVAKRLEADPTAGATKVDEVLFFAELANMRMRDEPLTGVEYQRLSHGPAPRRFVPIRDELAAEGAVRLETRLVGPYPQHRLIALREPDLSGLDPDEIDAVEQVISRLWGLSAIAVSELSHQELGWLVVGEGETIPYSSAYLRPVGTPIPEQVRKRAAELARLGPGAA